MCQTIITYHTCGCKGATYEKRCPHPRTSCATKLRNPEGMTMGTACFDHTHPALRDDYKPDGWPNPPRKSSSTKTLSGASAKSLGKRPIRGDRPIRSTMPPNSYSNNRRNPTASSTSPTSRAPTSLRRRPRLTTTSTTPARIPPRSSSLNWQAGMNSNSNAKPTGIRKPSTARRVQIRKSPLNPPLRWELGGASAQSTPQYSATHASRDLSYDAWAASAKAQPHELAKSKLLRSRLKELDKQNQKRSNCAVM